MQAVEKYPTHTIVVCLAKSETEVPLCNMRAVLVKTRPASDLALIQLRTTLFEKRWISLEEYVLRTKSKFSFATPDFKKLTEEGVRLGDGVKIISYGQNSSSTVNLISGEVSGLLRGLSKGKSIPSMVRLNSSFVMSQLGGSVFNASSTLIGITTVVKDKTTPNGLFVSLPLINSFLRDTLGNDYLAKKMPFVLTGKLEGVQAGLISTNICPSFSQRVGNVCRCNSGFYAVGNTCVLGMNYCQIQFGTNARYDDYLRVCKCPTTQGERTCVKAPAPAPAPKPTPAPTPKPPVPAKPATTTAKPFYCPAHASYDAKTWTCVCDKGWTRDVKKNACVAIPAKKK